LYREPSPAYTCATGGLGAEGRRKNFGHMNLEAIDKRNLALLGGVMALRILEVMLPQSAVGDVREVLSNDELPSTIAVWETSLGDKDTMIRIVAEAESTEALMDAISQRLSHTQGFRILIVPVEGMIPRPEEPEREQQEKPTPRVGRVSREELYSELADAASPNLVYMSLVGLSTIVAAVGLLHANLPAIVGAMVIAPFLGPNIALALATALGDYRLAQRAATSFIAGLVLSFVVSFVAGLIVGVDTTIPTISQVTNVWWGDIVLALASGIAGVLAFTTGISEALVGVMVAVALLPPWVTFGMLVGAGEYTAALRALMLFAANVMAINLAGVGLLLIQGVHPAAWWEKKKAKRASLIAMSVWLVLIMLLLIALYFLRLAKI
jgi:uncharacterized hydrophobic protein (TIGR00341 family)